MNKEKIKTKLKNAAEFIFNPRLLLCLLIAWFITNGWAYLLLGLGTLFANLVMISIAMGYITLLWIPFTPEKLITVAIAIFLLKVMFPGDTKTLAKLHALRERIKRDFAAGRQRVFGKKTAKQTNR